MKIVILLLGLFLLAAVNCEDNSPSKSNTPSSTSTQQAGKANEFEEEVKSKQKLIKELQSRLDNHTYVEVAMILVILFEGWRLVKLRKIYGNRPGGFVAESESKSSYDVETNEEIA